MVDTPFAWGMYGFAWALFGVLHSWLAGKRAKETLSSTLGYNYRLAYNIFAAVSFAALFAFGAHLFADSERFALSNVQRIGLSMMAVTGWVVLFIALTRYDLAAFSGTKQRRVQGNIADPDAEEPLKTDGFHRYVRHPLYSGAFLILWGAAWTPMGLATAVYGSAYIIVGTILEERRLLARYGTAYAVYRRRVPAYIPWRGRIGN